MFKYQVPVLPPVELSVPSIRFPSTVPVDEYVPQGSSTISEFITIVLSNNANVPGKEPPSNGIVSVKEQSLLKVTE